MTFGGLLFNLGPSSPQSTYDCRQNALMNDIGIVMENSDFVLMQRAYVSTHGEWTTDALGRPVWSESDRV